MNNLNIVQQFSIWLLPVLVGITVHEVAHGWMAKQLGDQTAFMLGRLNLNPIKHIDPIGTLLLPMVLFLLGSSFIFGWAKPVPVTIENFCHPRRDMALVAAAGPLSNLVMGLIWAGLIKVGYLLSTEEIMSWIGNPLIFMGIAGVLINSVLAVLNLLPIPPFDGGRIMIGILPPQLAIRLERIEPYSMIIVLILLTTGNLQRFINPVVNFVQTTIILIFNI